MSDQVSAQISAAVLDARSRSGASRESVIDAARRAGAPDRFTVPVLRNIEDGKRQPTVAEVLWLAAALEVPARDLVDADVAKAFAPAAAQHRAGPIEEELQAAISQIVAESPDGLDGREATLAKTALSLAGVLDRGGTQSPAAVAREMRMILAEVWRCGSPGSSERPRGEEGEFVPEL